MKKHRPNMLLCIAIGFTIWMGVWATLPVPSASAAVPMSIDGELTRGERLKIEINVERLSAYSGEAYVVFELLKGNTPLLINAVPVQQDEVSITQYFNVSGADYKVKVFVFDRFDSDLALPNLLARPMLFH